MTLKPDDIFFTSFPDFSLLVALGDGFFKINCFKNVPSIPINHFYKTLYRAKSKF